MKRIAVLVIAAVGEAVHRHYLSTYWTEVIRYTNEHTPHLDVFLLTEHDTPFGPFEHVAEHVIGDPDDAPHRHLPRGFEHVGLPGILSKTVHALDVLADRYDVFFRTNLSSMIVLDRFDRFVQDTEDLHYSGGLVWPDCLRSHLELHGLIGAGRSIETAEELSRYPGNTFVSGSGFFVSVDEARTLVTNRDLLRYDLPDDVAIGLMMSRHRVLDGFSEQIRATTPIADMLDRIRHTPAVHIRLERFPVERAAALWRYTDVDLLWR